MQLDNVLGVIFDTDACMIDYQIEDADATVMESRKKYYNIWWSFSKNTILDYTEQGVLLYMADVSPSPTPTSATLDMSRTNVTYQNQD